MYLTDENWLELTQSKVRQFLLENVDEDPAVFALKQSKKDFPYATIATQIKYLQRARKKLPTYFHHCAIIPPLAYEQSSSELVAELKELQGETLLDLTLGLGVDSSALSRRFTNITSLERDHVLSRITGYNFDLFGITNVEIRSETAENYLRSYTGPVYDWIYADPARRDAGGKRIHDVTQTDPNIIALLPDLQKAGRKLLVKASPLLDLRAAALMLPGVERVWVHSLDGEVKEVLVEVNLRKDQATPLEEVVVGIKIQQGDIRYSYAVPLLPTLDQSVEAPGDQFAYLCEPDPAIYKYQGLGTWYKANFGECSAHLNHLRGYFFSNNRPDNWPGRIFRLREQWPYKPKSLRRALADRGLKRLNVMRRHFPQDVSQIRKQLKIAEGGDLFLICTEWQGEKVAWLAERVS